MGNYQLLNVAVGKPKVMQYAGNQEMSTAIKKQSTEEVLLKVDGFDGDGVADLKHHGGVERAVCFYADERYEYWNNTYDNSLDKAAFGENLTVKGMLEEEVCIGDIYQIGEAVVTITQGRVPCNTIDRSTGLKGLFKQMIETGYTGYFAKVVKEGMIRPDSSIQLKERGKHRISVLQANRLFFQQIKDLNQMELLLQQEVLAEKWRSHFERLAAKFNS
ncbi:MOSC domain-containing protein [Alkalihalobacillus sp. NPDC078783]